MLWLQMNARRIWNRIEECLKDESGIGVVEIILIYRCTDRTCHYLQDPADRARSDDFQ